MKKIRYGIIGFGSFAERTILPAMRKSENSELVAIQKRSLDAARNKAGQHGIPLFFDSPEALVKSPEIDAVFIVSSNAQHHDETVAAAKAGKHVLVEKPMSVTYSEAEDMVNACKTRNVKFMVAHMVRFSPVLRRLKEIISSGVIGEISFARAEFMYNAQFSERKWLRDKKEAGGGPWYDIGVHCLDSMRFVLDDTVKTVTNIIRSETETLTEASSIVSVKFHKGVIGSIYTSFETGYRNIAIEFLGSKGSVGAHNFTLSNTISTVTTKRAEKGDVGETTVEKINVPDLYTREISHFSDCIIQNQEPFVPNESSLHNQFILENAFLSVNEK